MLALIQETSSGWSVLKDVLGSAAVTTILAASVALIVGHFLEVRREGTRAKRERQREDRDEKRLVEREAREEARTKRDYRTQHLVELQARTSAALDDADMALRAGSTLGVIVDEATGKIWLKEHASSLDTLHRIFCRDKIALGTALVEAERAVWNSVLNAGTSIESGILANDRSGGGEMISRGRREHRAEFLPARLALEGLFRRELGWVPLEVEGSDE